MNIKFFKNIFARASFFTLVGLLSLSYNNLTICKSASCKLDSVSKLTLDSNTKQYNEQNIAAQTDISKSEKDWTFLTYIAGDNDLEPFINQNLNQMKRGSSNNINVLAFVCTKRIGEPKVARKYKINPAGITQIGSNLPGLDSGRPDTVIKAIKWAREEYPSNHIAIVLWDHGSGWRKYGIDKETRGICYDYTTDNNLSDSDLRAIMKEASNIYGKKIDLLAFDACLMADLETTFAIAPYVDYFVASQETIPGTGFGYNYILDPFKERSLSPKVFAKWLIDAYNKTYSNTLNDYTLSAFKLSDFDKLVKNFDQITQKLIELLKENKEIVKKMISAAQANSLGFTYKDHKDLATFYAALRNQVKNSNLSSANKAWLDHKLLKGKDLINTLILCYTGSSDFSKARGVSVYLPSGRPDSSYRNLYWSTQNNWYNFLVLLNKA